MMQKIKLIIARVVSAKYTKTAGSAMEACHHALHRKVLLTTDQPTDKKAYA